LRKKYKEINSGIWQDFEKHLISAKDLRVERFRRFVEQENLNINPVEMSEKYLLFLSEGTYLIEGATKVVSAIKQPKALITNGLTEVQYPRIQNSPLAPYFNHIFISEEIGFPKPEPEIFEFAFKQVEYNNKSSAIIIGDNLSSDIKGGNNFGIDTCWFNIHNLENKTNIIPDYEISNLNEVLEIVL